MTAASGQRLWWVAATMPARTPSGRVIASSVEREQHGDGHAFADRLRDGAAKHVAVAEIAVQQAPVPKAELHGQRTVEAEGGADPLHLRARGVGARHHLRGVAGDDVDEGKGEKADQQQHRHGVRQPAQRVAEHQASQSSQSRMPS